VEWVIAQNLVAFEQLIAKCKLQNAKYKKGMGSFDCKALINVIC
jgi:hypothetical protein